MISPNDVLTHAMLLSEQERADIAHRLLLRLEPEDFEDEEIASEWQQEIENRLQKISDGTHQSHNWRQAIEELRQEFKKETKP